LGRFDHAAQQFIELRLVGGGNAFGLGLGNEVSQSVEPEGIVQR
jgi:hypothetical protein